MFNVRLCFWVLCFPWEGYQPIRKPPYFEDQFDNTRLPKQPSPTNPEEEGIADAPRNDGNASMPEQVKRPNSWRKMMMLFNV